MQEVKLNGQSIDIVKENVEKLKKIFPEIVTEDKIDFEKLKAVLGEYVEKDDESYRFTWHGKRDALRESQIPSTGTLRPCIEDSKNWDTTQNLYIEGDNLEVLKLLQKSYDNKVKMIYIDPPYNKDKDFIYPDKWSEPIKEYKKITGQLDDDDNIISSDTEGEGGKHTKWLNMMYPRLRLARNLLTEKGIIFIQIDDEEVSNLIKICNEIYGEENQIAIICVQMSYVSGEKMSHVNKKPPKIKEYILMYAKNKNVINLKPQYTAREISKEYNKFIEKNNSDNPKDWNVISLNTHFNKIGLTKQPDKQEYMYKNADLIFNRARSKAKEFIKTRNIKHPVFITTATGLKKMAWHGREAVFLSSKIRKNLEGKYEFVDALGDIWNDINITNIYQEGQVSFKNGKKPLKLIQRLIDYVNDDNAIVLDFFSGSSTTAEAVISQNVFDGGSRKFIMVQLPENLDALLNKADIVEKKNIKETIDFLDSINKPHFLTELGKERIRRAGESIKSELKQKYDAYKQKHQSILDDKEKAPMNPDDLDIGFKVFKLDSSNLKKWSVDVGEDFYKMSREEQNIILSKKLYFQINNFVDNRSELDVVYEIMLKYGLDLTYPIETYKFDGKNVYSIGYGGLIICLDEDINTELADKIVELIKKLKPSVVRVAVRDLGFNSDPSKTNFKETLKNGVYAYFSSSKDKTNKQNQFMFVTI